MILFACDPRSCGIRGGTGQESVLSHPALTLSTRGTGAVGVDPLTVTPSHLGRIPPKKMWSSLPQLRNHPPQGPSSPLAVLNPEDCLVPFPQRSGQFSPLLQTGTRHHMHICTCKCSGVRVHTHTHTLTHAHLTCRSFFLHLSRVYKSFASSGNAFFH